MLVNQTHRSGIMTVQKEIYWLWAAAAATSRVGCTAALDYPVFYNWMLPILYYAVPCIEPAKTRFMRRARIVAASSHTASFPRGQYSLWGTSKADAGGAPAANDMNVVFSQPTKFPKGVNLRSCTTGTGWPARVKRVSSFIGTIARFSDHVQTFVSMPSIVALPANLAECL